MRVIILGGDGMLGHKVFQIFSPRFDTYATFRETDGGWRRYPLFAGVAPERIVEGVDALAFDTVAGAVTRVRPDAVINCIGIVKQRRDAKAAIPSIRINSLFPHQLAELCQAAGARLVHLSTDCVFSGARGGYVETDPADPPDLYGRTKLLGEVEGPGCLTLRTSIIGWELRNFASLLEWFAVQHGRTVKGYRRAIYTGVSTAVMARLLADILEKHPRLSGLYHAVSQAISKHDILLRLRDALGWKDITIVPDDEFVCDRSMVGAHLEAQTGWTAPAWDEMIAELAKDRLAYEAWRKV